MRAWVCGVCVFAGLAGAQVDAISGVLVDARNFNDFPGSELAIVEAFPQVVRVREEEFGASRGFANRHRFFYTADGVSQFVFDNQTAFDISIDVLLDGGTDTGKEAGFYFDRFGEPRFLVKGDGEVAAFDGAFPFFSFGNVYEPGTTARMRVIYRPGSGPDMVTPATIEYRFNGMSSGRLEFSNLENGMIDGTVGGFYAQFAPDRQNAEDFGLAVFRRVRIAVPGAGTGVVVLMGCAAVGRRRR